MNDYFYSLAAIAAMNMVWDSPATTFDNGLLLLRIANEENQ